MVKRVFAISEGTLAKASLLGAKTVKVPGELSTPARFARTRAARRIERLGVAMTSSASVDRL